MYSNDMTDEQRQMIERWSSTKRAVLNDLIADESGGVVWAAKEAEKCEKAITRLTVTIADLSLDTHSQAIASAESSLAECRGRLMQVTDQAVTGKIILAYLRKQVDPCDG